MRVAQVGHELDAFGRERRSAHAERAHARGEVRDDRRPGAIAGGLSGDDEEVAAVHDAGSGSAGAAACSLERREQAPRRRARRGTTPMPGTAAIASSEGSVDVGEVLQAVAGQDDLLVDAALLRLVLAPAREALLARASRAHDGARDAHLLEPDAILVGDRSVLDARGDRVEHVVRDRARAAPAHRAADASELVERLGLRARDLEEDVRAEHLVRRHVQLAREQLADVGEVAQDWQLVSRERGRSP